MSIRITDDAMTSDVTRHTARRVREGWVLSWLPGRVFDRNQATTGMVLAEAAAEMQADEADHTHRLWPHIDAWAAELGLSGPDAFVRVCEPDGVSITTFGYRHGGPPSNAHLTLDLREHFRDPHVSLELRYLTACDAAVRVAVLGTAGVRSLIEATTAAVLAFLSGPSAGPVRVAVGCVGGRHRAATVGMALADALEVRGAAVRLTHRDIAKEVVAR